MVSYKGAADALAGAVAMQRAVERRNRRSRGPALAMRVGVSAGDATFEDGDWFGTPVIEASRLCAAAAGGQILVSDLVRVLAGSRCEFEVRPARRARAQGPARRRSRCATSTGGVGRRRRRSRSRRSSTPRRLPVRRRAAELRHVAVAWKEIAEGDAPAVLVSGEPGIGKTRLVSELVRIAHDAGRARCCGVVATRSSARRSSRSPRRCATTRACVPAERLRAELGPLGGELTRLLPELDARVPGSGRAGAGRPRDRAPSACSKR